jgi:hypothetical protein
MTPNKQGSKPRSWNPTHRPKGPQEMRGRGGKPRNKGVGGHLFQQVAELRGGWVDVAVGPAPRVGCQGSWSAVWPGKREVSLASAWRPQTARPESARRNGGRRERRQQTTSAGPAGLARPRSRPPPATWRGRTAPARSPARPSAAGGTAPLTAPRRGPLLGSFDVAVWAVGGFSWRFFVAAFLWRLVELAGIQHLPKLLAAPAADQQDVLQPPTHRRASAQAAAWSPRKREPPQSAPAPTRGASAARTAGAGGDGVAKVRCPGAGAGWGARLALCLLVQGLWGMVKTGGTTAG